MEGLAKLAEFKEDHWQPKKNKNKKKELAEDVAIAGLGTKGGSLIGGLTGAAAGKKKPLEHPVGFDTVKTRSARKLVNGALHNRQAKWSTIKGGTIGAGIGLGVAGLGIAYKHQQHEKTAASDIQLPRELSLYGVLDALFHHQKTADEHTIDLPETLTLVERTANPATRHKAISELFSNNQLHRYENISAIPFIHGHKGELDILKPKKLFTSDTADQGGNYHSIMQGAAKHWAETGRGFHAKKS